MLKSHPLSNIKGLYAITPDTLDTEHLIAKVQSVLEGGVCLLQYRNKLADAALRLQQANALLRLCHSYSVPLIINDHVALCAEIDADGLHLGADDDQLIEARKLLGQHKIIGVSCYNQLVLAKKAQADGADYVAFGACFASSTKPKAPIAPLSLFAQAKQELHIPIVAIGGITLKNAQQVKQAGADVIAVISAVFNADSITETSQQFHLTFKQ
ncbi:MAG: thiamine phosphate synthase [Methylophilaceae bacterium]|jgi:thiamine-phosphate pyrophosphorylase|nr:MAG: thiamine phosphate synthase [Methylophilaceae bacterium]